MAITHVLVIPFPGQGHVNPIMLFSENWWSMVSDSTDEHTDVPDEVTMTNVRWWVKGSVTPDEDTGSSNTSKNSRRLPSQTGKSLEPIKAPLLGKGVTSVALTTHNG